MKNWGEWVESESYYDTPPPPEPTHVYAGSAYEKGVDGTGVTPSRPTGADKATQAATVPLDLPVETGRVGVHVHGKHRHAGIESS